MYFARLPDAERLNQLKEEFNFTCTNDCCLGDPAGSSSVIKQLENEQFAGLPDTIGRYLCYWDQDKAQSSYMEMMIHLKKFFVTMTAQEFLFKQKKAFLSLQFSVRPNSQLKSDPSPQ